jgi:hypothetical protein
MRLLITRFSLLLLFIFPQGVRFVAHASLEAQRKALATPISRLCRSPKSVTCHDPMQSHVLAFWPRPCQLVLLCCAVQMLYGSCPVRKCSDGTRYTACVAFVRRSFAIAALRARAAQSWPHLPFEPISLSPIVGLTRSDIQTGFI